MEFELTLDNTFHNKMWPKFSRNEFSCSCVLYREDFYLLQAVIALNRILLFVIIVVTSKISNSSQ